MPDEVTLIGLDFGTTTSSAVVASARLTRSAATGRRDLTEVHERYRSDMVFTPLDENGRLDESRVAALLDGWLAAGAVDSAQVFGGGALLTGMTAQRENAAAIVRLVRERLGDALIATADDPRLESWLAFMGSCATLSRNHPRQPILNLDIGGGTTNFALGRDGQVQRTGCFYIGARHVRVVPGTYEIAALTKYAEAVLQYLKIDREVGDVLAPGEVDAMIDHSLALLEAAATGATQTFEHPVAQQHVQVPFVLAPSESDAAITFSGGVGELIYASIDGHPWPATTQFGDLGIDLARRIVESKVFAPHIRRLQPDSAGRATVYGLLRHTTEISGSTLFLPDSKILPLADLPIFGSWYRDSTEADLTSLIDLVRHSPRGGCVQVRLGTSDAAALRQFGTRLADALDQAAFPTDLPLVLLVRENLGKILGSYVTRWGALPLNLIVVDEVAERDAQFVQIGTPHSQVVPVSFYGLNEPGDARCTH
ncbi:MAG: ethanolamine ammonia-lyase reactivating factor EutA [Planctomycetaceae bacterium]|nr:ethanolamine ammonia-lyase reactivating factor EutA [Planctomycetaceae bacterium]